VERGQTKCHSCGSRNLGKKNLTPHFFRKVRGKQYAYSAEVVSATKAGQNPNDRNRKKEEGFENLNFGNWDLFRV